PAGSLSGTVTLTGVPDGTTEGNETVVVDITTVTNGTELGTQQVTAILDDTAPTADVVDVTPDPRTTPVAIITIAFSEAVAGFDKPDLALTRNGSAVSLGTATLTTSDNVTWTLGNLTSLTGALGNYVLTLTAAGSGIADLAGNPLAADANTSWSVVAPPSV